MRPRYGKDRKAAILLNVSRIVSSTLDLDTVSELVLKESMKALGADHASLFLLDEDSGRLMLTKADGFSKDEIDNLKLLGGWEVINEQLIKRKITLVVNNLHRNSIFRRKKIPFSKEGIPIYSFLAVPLVKDGRIVGALIVSNRRRPGHLFTSEDKRLMITLSNHIAIAIQNARLYQSLKSLFISTVASLARAIDAKDRYTAGHSERVMKYAVAIGRQLELDDERIEYLRLSSILHDVGKIGIKESILSKPATLSPAEKRQINVHPSIGARIVETIDNSHMILKGILEHHERFDGSGYPSRLKGNKISLDGRIIAVADTFDALTTNRPYRKKYSAREAFFEIRKNSLHQFDPHVVKAFTLSFSKEKESWRV